MILSAAMMSVVNLLLYCVQQLGVVLGVGAETVILVSVLWALRDGVLNNKEERFYKAVRHVRTAGIVLILLSGVAITALEFQAQHGLVVFAPAYLFKCALIGAVLLLAASVRGVSAGAEIAEGAAGGTWYALFVIHILAPVATWTMLGEIYALWLVAFMFCWTVLVFSLRGHQTVRVVEARTTPVLNPIADSRHRPSPAVFTIDPVTAPPTTVAKPYIGNLSSQSNTAAVPKKVFATGPIPPAPHPRIQSSQQSPVESTTNAVLPGLPPIRVMPKKPEDLVTQHRAPAVQFG
jgi:hypothetical protein